jgi:glycosyltransferase involved in cell wall biosynthesis
MTVTFAVQGWLLGTGPSGANRRLVELLRALRGQLRSDERVVVLGDPRQSPFPVTGLPVSWVEAPIPPGPPWHRWLAEALHLPALLRSLEARVFAASTLPLPATGGVPVVFTLHDCRAFAGLGTRAQNLLFAPLLRRALRRAAAVVVPSEFTRAEVVERLPGCDRRIQVVANGVAAGFARVLPGTRPPCLLHVGRLEARKNAGLLVEAYARARARGALPPLVFAGAGHGVERDRIAARARVLGLSADVRFLCSVADAELPELYAAASCVLVPSRYEGFGIPVAEAQAAGVPVVTSDQGALPELGGHVLPVGDVDAWAAVMAAPPPAGPVRVRGWEQAAAAELAIWRASAQGP